MTNVYQSKSNRSAAWHRQGDDWHLISENGALARIDRDGPRWLCYALDEGENDTYLGPCRSLASGKAHLSTHYGAAFPANRIADGEAPM